MDRNSKNHTIVLIDPHTETHQLITSLFDADSLSIIKFSSALVALENIKEIKPDLIISEFYTDDLTAGEAFRLLITDLRYRTFRSVPFVIFTGIKTKEKEELVNLGISGWFTKPFGRKELKEVIENLFLSSKVMEMTQELQQQVKRSEYQYRDLLENANDFIFTLDDKGVFTYLNNRFNSLTGWQKNQWLHKPFISCIHPLDSRTVLEHYRMVHLGKSRIFEARIQGNKEDIVVLSFNISPLFERGVIVGSLGIARDVTEQKEMERELIELKNFNESIIQSMESGLLTLDLDGKITFLNSGGEKILGWDAKTVSGKHLSDILGQKQADLFLLSNHSDDPLSARKEVELTIDGENNIYLGFSTTDRIDNNGHKVGTIIFFKDISMLKQMQSEVIRMDRLVSLGVLASGIAHEIKNPLAGIKTMAQACQEEFENDDPREEYLVRIVRQVNRLDDLLKTFFAYARPKKPDRRPHKLSDIVQEVTRLLSKKFSTSTVECTEHYESDLKSILVDSQQMQQVLLNLILNAIDAMPEGGRLEIKGVNIANVKNNRPLVLVSIQDTGEGIPQEKIETIFDPFYTSKPNGLGLGLSIVYRIINEHDGDIKVESKQGKGTIFYITLPAGDI
ncbi:PAS domain S-box protein [bacterium]|nr:PAS domain S-box protein [bacterium]